MMKTSIAIAAALLCAGGIALAHPGGGRHFERIDADGNGQLTLAELRQGTAAMFGEIDADKDGRVTPAEFRAHHGKMRAEHGGGGKHGKGGGPDRGPMGLDTDGDGAVSLAEFQARAERHFASMDANGDGTVTAEERKAGRHGGHGRR